MKPVTVFFSTVLLFCTAVLNADEGGLAMPLAMQNGTARTAALGSAYAGLAQGASALLWNPAGLGGLKGVELGLHHNSGLGGIMQEIAILGFDSADAGGFGVSVNYLNSGLFERRDDFGNLMAGVNTGAEFGGSLGWGKEVLPGFFTGAAVKTGAKTLADRAYYILAADAGILWEAASFLKLGAAYINMGGATGGFPVASGFRLGASCNIEFSAGSGMMMVFSGESHTGGASTLNTGLELKGFSVLSGRVGYVYNFSNAQLGGLAGLTAGFGVKLQGIELDYAYVPFGDLGAAHKVSLVYSVPQKPKAAQVMPAQPPQPEKKKVLLPRSDSRVISFELVHFEFDKSSITAEARLILEKNIIILKNNPDTEVLISGFTSMRGGEKYNQKLSERRAYAIRNFMIRDGGITAERLTIIGYGDTNPAVLELKPDEKNSDAAKSNRRAIFEIVKK